MKRLLGLLLLGGIIYAGYLYYSHSILQNRESVLVPKRPNILLITQASDQLGHLAAVLGASAKNLLTNGQELLSTATGGQSDPIINRALTNIQNEVKDLPKEAVDKVKYEFCKDVVTEYEKGK